MRTVFFLALLFGMSLLSFGQSLQLTVIDSLTNESLPYANIYFKHSGIGATTNMKGQANFDLSELQATDTLVVSYIGYRTLGLPFSKNEPQAVSKIQLVPTDPVLEDVVIAYTKPIKPEKIIKNAIKSIPKNYPGQDVIYNALYRETIQEDGRYIQLNEAFVKTYYTSYPQKRLDPKLWQSRYRNDYAFDLEGNYLFHPLLKDLNTANDKQAVVASRISENWSQHSILPSLIGGPLRLFAFDKIKYQYDFFHPPILHKYSFKHEQAEIVNGEVCYVISFYPKATTREFHSIQSRKNKSAIYIGRIYISKDNNALLKFKYQLAVDRDFGFFAKAMPLDYQVEMNYQKRGDHYFIDHISFEETKQVDKKDNGEAILHTASTELHVLDVQTENVKPFPDSTIFKSTIYSSLRYYRAHYNPSYWNSHPLPKQVQLPPKVVSDLSQKEPLQQQFARFKDPKKLALAEPQADKAFYAFDYHDQTFVDSLHWMAAPENGARLKRYLEEENKYARNELLETRAKQKRLFNKLLNFYPEGENKEKEVHPIGSYFYLQDSLNQGIYYFQKDSLTRVEVLNQTAFKAQHPETFVRRMIPNPGKSRILIQYAKPSIIGDFVNVQAFGNTTTQDSVAHTYSVEWLNDSVIVYSKTNQIGSARELRSRNINSQKDVLIYSEPDPTFDVEVMQENGQLFCTLQSKTENEIHWIQAENDTPTLQRIKARKTGVTYSLKSSDGLYVLTNDENAGSMIEFASFEAPDKFSVLANIGKKDYIEDFVPLQDRVVALSFQKSFPKLIYLKKGDKKWKPLEPKTLGIDLGSKSEGIGQYTISSSSKKPNSLNFSFSAPSKPFTTYSYDFATSAISETWKLKVKSPNYYRYTHTKRLWAKSHDGTKVPITLIRDGAASGKSGLILKVYGAYGANTTPAFDAKEAILLQQGYTIAHAHVRGESIMGSSWYKAGRVLNKQNSILDYLACAEYLIKKGYASPKNLVAYGNSAGGLVVGQAINLQPELFKTAILDHAYLDVVTTMMNDSLPLTVDEYKEWGNPADKEVFDYMMGYSPYQNIRAQRYPRVLLIASYQDYQTPVWQIAKYAARLREHNLGDDRVVLLTDMNSGHAGSTIGTEWIKVFAEIWGFVGMGQKR